MADNIIQKLAIEENGSAPLPSHTKASINRAHLINAYRKYVRTKWQIPLHLKYQQMLLEGKYPFEKGWRTEHEIAALKATLHKRDRAIFFDLILVFGLVLILNMLLLAIIFLVIDAA